jgi:hypothetical protein
LSLIDPQRRDSKSAVDDSEKPIKAIRRLSDQFVGSQGAAVSPLSRFPSIQSSQIRIPTTESPAQSSALANSLVEQPSRDLGHSPNTPSKPFNRAQFDLKPLGDRFKFLDKVKAPYEAPKTKPKAPQVV